MIKCDFHMHTVFCDGKNTPEEMVLAAIGRGVECMGFSGHSYSPGDADTEIGMTDDVCRLYRNEIYRLREKYAGEIEILCGIEMDYWSENDTSPFDYIIGSVHELRVPGGRALVDYSPERQTEAIDRYFCGDPMSFAECYFETEADVAGKTGCDVIGHFDLLTKFNERYPVFDTEDPRYIRAWQAAADRLLGFGIPFEINTGAISRGWRTVPYPAPDMIEYIKNHGGRFVLSSDSHDCSTICNRFDELERRYPDLTLLTEAPRRNRQS